MKEPIRILSDLHLGHPASKIQDVGALRPLLPGAGTVVFNGDTWQELARAFRPLAEKQLAELKSLCESEGVEAIFLSGNHDPGWEGTGWLELAGGRIIITHGDAVLWSGSPWSREALTQREMIRRLWEEHRGAEDDAGERLRLAREMARNLQALSPPKGKTLIRRVLDAVNPPMRAFEIINIWFRQPIEAANFARHYFPDSETIIIGHFHQPGVWNYHGRSVINTGAFLHPHYPMWVEWSNGWLKTGKVVKKENWELGNPVKVWRFS